MEVSAGLNDPYFPQVLENPATVLEGVFFLLFLLAGVIFATDGLINDWPSNPWPIVSLVPILAGMIIIRDLVMMPPRAAVGAHGIKFHLRMNRNRVIPRDLLIVAELRKDIRKRKAFFTMVNTVGKNPPYIVSLELADPPAEEKRGRNGEHEASLPHGHQTL